MSYCVTLVRVAVMRKIWKLLEFEMKDSHLIQQPHYWVNIHRGKMLECQKDIALLWSLLHNSQKPRTTSTGRVSDDWMRQMQPTHAVEYYLNIRILFCNSWKHTLACCVQQNKFNTERQKLHDLMHFWNLNADLIEVEARMVVTRVGDFRLPEGGRKVGQRALSCTWKQNFWCSTSQENGER